jgi:uncharacterized RDD family membrane protein YckC
LYVLSFAGVNASAAQKQPVTKTCSQCGAILPSSVGACNFCESSLLTESSSSFEKAPVSRSRANLPFEAQEKPSEQVYPSKEVTAWRDELAQRLASYRTRRRKPNAAQSRFSFEDMTEEPPSQSSARTPVQAVQPQNSFRTSVETSLQIPAQASVQVPAQPSMQTAVTVDESARAEEDFSFTIAIGRPSKKLIQESGRMEIDVSLPPDSNTTAIGPDVPEPQSTSNGLYPVASMDDRRIAALADAACLLFAYGGFLMLFGSLGGQFTLSKLSAAVYASTFAIVYLQYFALFTIFGGTTPGMMLRGLQVVSFSGEPPTPRQMLWRSAGYVLSAGTFFLGFLWSMWDEDELTWHDRVSHTYLSNAQSFTEFEGSAAAHSR